MLQLGSFCASRAVSMEGEGAWNGRSLLEGLAGHLDEGQHQGAQRQRAKAGAQREPG